MSSKTTARVNRIPSSASRSSSSSSKNSRKKSRGKTAKKSKKTTPSALTTHIRICSELYGVTYGFAKSDYEMKMLYYNKENRDEDGNILYPRVFERLGVPLDKFLIRKPWTGEAIPNPNGPSANAVLV
jgi:hypothetical protein